MIKLLLVLQSQHFTFFFSFTTGVRTIDNMQWEKSVKKQWGISKIGHCAVSENNPVQWLSYWRVYSPCRPWLSFHHLILNEYFLFFPKMQHKVARHTVFDGVNFWFVTGMCENLFYLNIGAFRPYYTIAIARLLVLLAVNINLCIMEVEMLLLWLL